MKTLIVGSTSVIGRACGRKLEMDGDVKFAGRRDADISVDLTRWDQLPEINERFDVVIHAAADFGGTSGDDIVRAELVNAVGTASVCRLAQAVEASHLVIVSSISACYQPSDPFYGIYSLSKRHAEEVAQLFCSVIGLPLAILRPSQIYDDEGGCRRHQPLLYHMVDRAQAGEDIVVYGKHDAVRNYLHIEDLSEICRLVVRQRLTGCHSCSSPNSVRLSEIASTAFSIFGRGGGVRFQPDKPDVADLPDIDLGVLYDVLNYRPQVNLREGMARIKTYREAHS